MKIRKVFFTLCLVVLTLFLSFSSVAVADAEMPFYDLDPKPSVLRAEFTTDYAKSSAERKHNIALAAKALNGAFIDVKAEFSFNDTVGERSAARGYENAKIIVKGKFVDGVGGGVCQVSTTLYNAAILAGLKVTEQHAHSLSVSYVEPSFDAMVNSGSADLKFVNATHNPVIIRTAADGEKLTVRVYGEKMREKIRRKSVIKEYVDAPMEKIIDEKSEYPDLYEGEERVVSYGKKGIKSEGYVIIDKNGKRTSEKLRSDYYAPISGQVVVGTAVKEKSFFDFFFPLIFY